MSPASATTQYKPQTPTFVPVPSANPFTPTPTTIETIENKIRAHIFAKRIRLVDLFADFDKLRSGFVSAPQFRRCLGGAMERGVVSAPLTETEYATLADFYRGTNIDTNDRIKWIDFVDSIDK
ncbi:hypothetical protein HK100_007262, partial [Physocladia obscura]